MKISKIWLYFISVLALLVFTWSCSSKQQPVQQVPEIATQETVTEEPPPEEVQAEEPPPVAMEETKEGIQEISQEQQEEQEEPERKRTAAEILEDALSAYQDAQIAWSKTDIDTALAALDDAYSLLLQLELPQESPLNQEKNDLRLLIAQRIQEIYASHLIAVGENHKSIPLFENQDVLAEIKSFQTVERKYFEDAYRRSGLYREMILEELRKEAMPEELSWVPIFESGFKVNAYSSARALGLWQFISSTGYRFGLNRTRWVDERMDPEKSTRAAIQYLKELHAFFGDWTTALAAYNCGEFRVQRLIRNQRINYLDNFWDLYKLLPRETARFVPRFIATILIINNPEKYGITLPTPDPPIDYETVEIYRPVKLSTLSSNMGLSADEMDKLNPELRHKSTPEGEYSLKVPVGYGEKTLAALESTARWIPPEATYSIHYVRKGETVGGIARRYRTSISTIAHLNGLNRRYTIYPGQRLKVSGSSGSSSTSAQSRELVREGEKLVYVVKRGDSLYQIASSFNTSVAEIKRRNSLTSNTLQVGQKLTIQTGNLSGAAQYTVRSGDTPFEIAKKFGINLSVLLSLNGLNSRSKIYPGQKLWINSNNNLP
ncbi:MAG TPA: LysM peptidoglycan-binding domain-containing protein [Candidatus Heimdallarchaeota archaeon]|nr:LysM peptidoglycan-binding domain-containing protein [Candidatus Heimdallarchaeota archaeon]